MTALDGMDGGNCMARSYLWEFKNRREQHKYLVRFERNAKFCLRQTHNFTKHSKERHRTIYNIRHNRGWSLKRGTADWVSR